MLSELISGNSSIGVGHWGAVMAAASPPPSWSEIHFIGTLSSERTIVFPKNRCGLRGLDNNSFGQQMSDFGNSLQPP